eukprot:TRINITY_DN21138_c0_g1_i1.p1 TRINITY_DN21138_c0_g1~~TRINITY_DN21138_c0_g1_i1.p1  ORF type:complete len:153 (-),score=19.16 TRINITY_DN21138_c0_g1_i1:88-546(-)
MYLNPTQCYEIDPKFPEAHPRRNTALIKKRTLLIIYPLLKSKLPKSVYEVLVFLCNTVKKKFPDHNPETIALSFLFLRFICPAVIDPVGFGIVSEPPTSNMQRGCIIVSKVLQNIANGVDFEKEEYMKGFNDFIAKQNPVVLEFMVNRLSSK